MKFSMDSFHHKYDTDETKLTVNGRDFRLLIPSSLDGFIDPGNLYHDFPLWAKVWEASLVLADWVAHMKPDPEKRWLEIGSGLGLVGMTASTFGHHVTATEHNPDALAFARANAHINGCSNLKIEPLDWHQPKLEGMFDVIVGSEVAYRETDFKPLRTLFKTFLNPDGEIILTSAMRKINMLFYGEMQKYFNIKAQKKTLRSDEETMDILLCKMTPK